MTAVSVSDTTMTKTKLSGLSGSTYIGKEDNSKYDKYL